MKEKERMVAAERTAELYALESGRVLKLFRNGLPRTMAEEEFRIAQNVFRSGLHVPEPFEFLEREGRVGVVYEKAEGHTMLAAIFQNPGIVETEARRMARIHAEIHGRKAEGLPRLKAALERRISDAPLLSAEEKAGIVLKLEELEDGGSLCHGDFHPDNVILGQKEWVIDWMTATAGSPAADVARTLLMLEHGALPDELPPSAIEFFTGIRQELAAAYMNEYTRLTRIPREEIVKWMVPVASARLTEWIPDSEKEKLLELIRKQ
ncbi:MULTISPECIES: phosphotransferase family protein [Paenibacillus]|uniref:Aminoglycoside phosphotransferase n=1 Tax=Paenibacillus albilobatus TaxID=2716884 RepID=A0A920C8A5_9BACL|nr:MULTISPECIES: aminoglycoside phosphotransferase family protein [Paenibacillus]GIO29740.1 aminoglycoside phosphotransferase [Paenibacillus albilobatus]